ncbi:erythrocyte membrane protein 1, PfEMP1, putative [Plasmodium sp.]|nr:erythrocyte membrane protein 1, PfEMP1, putative [Plasmodium sp.]
MAPSPTPATSTSDDNRTARDILEGFGKEVQEEAHRDAQRRSKGLLKGNLSQATYTNNKGDNENPSDPCNLDHTKHTNVVNGRQQENPCFGRQTYRFSNSRSGQCTYNRIKDSEHNDNTVGACAPYRRLHICDYNLENINDYGNINNNTLLADVCLAAKHEGESLVEEHEKYKETNRDSKICTALARSFADIGDIIRGKDLFLGNQQEKKRLEDNLKKIFGKLQEKLHTSIKSQYGDNDGNFYLLREDWWNANRDQVWHAITCKAPKDDIYSTNIKYGTMGFSDGHCGNKDGTVLTNLDYVPQFLRWFDEWADDFCRIRKHKLKNIKNACRNEENGIYCSLNGYDCTKTSWKNDFEPRETYCTGCFSRCSLYKIWVGNQKKEFEKQKEKYKNEIPKYVLNKDKHGTNINKEYYKDFYRKLKDKYEILDNFLNLLNKGNYCKEYVKGENYIDFNSDVNTTFSLSKYCEVCPDCGVECTDGKCKPKEYVTYPNCVKKEIYIPDGVEIINIDVIHSADKEGGITKKLEDFCSEGNNKNLKNYEKWECYYKRSDDNKCKMDTNSGKGMTENKITTFNEFFHWWVTNLLVDTINWDKELNNCINNTTTQCNDDCNKRCVCFDKWVKQKEEEWKKMVELFKKKPNIRQKYYININDLFYRFFYEVLNEFDHDEAKWKELTDELGTNVDSSKGKEGTGNSQDAINVLLDHLKEKATICKDNNTNEACDSNVNRTTTPCVNNTTTTTGSNNKRATVKQIAQYYKRKAYNEANKRSDGLYKLKGRAHKGEYELQGKASVLTDICNIKNEHSNRDIGQSHEPCYNKDNKNEMFVMEHAWIPHDFTSTTHENFYMSPRRKHFCTSNLEHLKIDASGLKNSSLTSHSLLGDVLLAAKEQANFIKKKYNDKDKPNGFSDNATMCRAIKYSFADIGDIIKGTDLWDGIVWDKNTENKLVEIFVKIKENLDETTIKKYSNDNDSNRYINLRKDWWEANRAKVWEAMKCEISDLKDPSIGSSKSHCGYSDHTPLDDYIPKKLRWLTEWAEWFCKMQSQEYDKLKEGCQECKDKDKFKKCIQGNSECGKCTTARDAYERKIDVWKEQWKTVSAIYQILYANARIHAFNGGPEYYTTRVQKEDQSVYDFLYELHLQNGGKKGPPDDTHRVTNNAARVERATTDETTPTVDTPSTVYSTPEGYIHQEAYLDDCQKQNVFCNEKNKEYAFKDTPHDYDDLRCLKRKVIRVQLQDPTEEKTKKNAKAPPRASSAPRGRPSPPALKEKKDNVDVCKMVKDLLKRNDGTTEINGCKPKSNGNTWDCSNQIDGSHNGACMPPRRQSLCLHDLTVESDTKDKDKLKDPFIRCVAKEIHFLWHKYKRNKNNAEDQLKDGTIPEDFKRIMYYTFGDYRDILFDTDISAKSGHILTVQKNINEAFGNNKSLSARKEWWEKNKSDIWEGILCALPNSENFKHKKEYKEPPERFSSRTQFLRWFTEWSDQFCTEREEKEKKVVEGCSSAKEYDGCKNNNGKDSCVSACKDYENYIRDKKQQYNKQNKKFEAEKCTSKPEYKDYCNKDAFEYFEKECLDGTCDYMKKVKKITDYWYKPFETYNEKSLQKKCSCSPSPCTIVHSILGDKTSIGYREGCKQKYGNGMYNGWDCSNSVEKGNQGACIPPRRQKLYVYNIKELKDETQNGLRTAFIECAAVETFFAWHKYKKDKKNEKNEEIYIGGELSPEEKAQNELETGEIPDDFKRQMFYTFGDYRDICLGNDIGSDMKDVQTNINKFITNIGSKNVQERKDFWNKYAKDIWDAMVCALSYNTETKIKNEELHKKLIDPNNKKRNENVTFSTVKITTFLEFSEKTQYIRWFEEWADEFCRKKKLKLENIKKDCRVEHGKNKCSDEGYSCDLIEQTNNNIFKNFLCPSCEKDCTNYKKWINTKKNEFHKHKEKYEKKYKGDKHRVDTVNGKNNVTLYDELKKEYKEHKFFEFLKKGPICKNIDESIQIDSNDPEKTFSHSYNCKSCPILEHICVHKKCESKNVTKCKKTKFFKGTEIRTEEPIPIDILVDNNKKKNISYDIKSDYKECDLFKNLGKQQWECKYICNLDVCELKKIDNDIENEELISIEVLIKRWLEYFLKDYNKIKKILNPCINNETNTLCIKDCYKNFECVKKWIGTKTEEWKKIKERYLKQYNNEDEDISYNLKVFLQQGIFTNYINNALDKGETLHTLKELDECVQPNKSNGKPCEKKDVITVLFNRLTEKINAYQNQHKDPKDIEGCRTLPISIEEEDNDDTDIPPHVLPPFCNVHPNPCGETRNATNVVTVMEVAKEIQQQTHDKMMDRSAKNGETNVIKGREKVSVLKGDISNLKFNNGAKPSQLDGNKTCQINNKHSNDNRRNNNNYKGPCEGKGNRFKIETIWRDAKFVSNIHKDVYMPPRRQHFCTSNLEKLNMNNVTNSSNVNASFLVDVLFAANKEAQRSKERYKNLDEHLNACRAIRYSFADIGDIIKGTDMWDNDKGEKKTQENLVKIFNEIKKNLDDTIKEKYASDTDDPKHLELRKDWWEANRNQVWKAMKCHISKFKDASVNSSSSSNCGYSDTTPLDDYIPQRLRWMTEWSEWYCKMQKKEYDELEKKCSECRSGKCKNGDGECDSCKAACRAYERKIKPWTDQWEKIKEKYDKLYRKAESDAATDDSKDEKDVLDFLKKVLDKNKDNKIYSTSAGYIHQEAKYIDCHTQTQFCDKKNGETSTSADKKVDNDKYAFMQPPKEYEKACACVNNKKRITPHRTVLWKGHWEPLKPLEMFKKRTKKKTTCEIVEEILKDSDGTKQVDECHQKGTYSEWKCDQNKIKDADVGSCMPPRREKLCLHYLKQAMTNTEQLKNAFVKCAAAETFLLWHKYKDDKKKKQTSAGTTTQLDNKLKDGEIPEEFKRQMFYTFSDYRDLCVGTDISSKTDTLSAVVKAKYNIDHIFYTIGQISIHHRKNWWETNGAVIWEGMLCALSYNKETNQMDNNTHKNLTEKNEYSTVSSKLEEFSKIPQFLRWFTEWGEHFCIEQKKQFDELLEKCNSCIVSDSVITDGNKTCNDKENCDACKHQCKKYKGWLGTWKEHYNKQNEKFQRDKKSGTYEKDPGATQAKNTNDARVYLDTQLKKMICKNGTSEKCDYNCMNQTSPTNTEMPESLDDEPKDIKEKCNCVLDKCSGLSVTGSGIPDGSAFGGGAPADKCTVFKGGLPEKSVPPQSDYINNILSTTIPVGITLALGSIAFLFIRKKPKSSVELIRVLDIHKGDYGIPTPKSSNRYIPYASDTYKGKTYIYMEGDSSGDEKYAFMSDTTDVTSSESEYEELDINDIYPYTSPKYKTLIEVVLEPSKSGANTPSKGDGNTLSDMVSTTIFTDEEWNELKHDFISQYVVSEPMDVPQYDVLKELPMNTTEGNILDDGMHEKPFITSIHDRDLYTGEEISYNINMSTNSMDDTKYVSNNVYSGIDLINDTLSGNKHIDIYDEVLKRKENELFGTNNTKNTSNNNVAKLTNSDPIMNQLDLLHKWLDRHRDMCEKWNNKEDILNKLNEQWNKDNNSDDIPNDNKTLNTDVTIQIDMDDPKGKKEFSNKDTILDDMEDDIYYDVNDEKPFVDDIPMDHNKVDIPKKVHVEMKILNNTSNGSLEPEFPISDVWNI